MASGSASLFSGPAWAAIRFAERIDEYAGGVRMKPPFIA